MGEDEPLESGDLARHRQSCSRKNEFPVFRRPRFGRCTHSHGCHQIFQTRHPALGGAAEGNNSSERVHKTRTSAGTCPHSFSSVCYDSPTNLEFSQADRFVVGDDMGNLCPARGSTPPDVSGCGAAKPNDSLLCGNPQLRFGAGEPKQSQLEVGRAGSETPPPNFESGRVGRGYSAGPAVPLRRRRTFALIGKEGKGQRPFVQLQS